MPNLPDDPPLDIPPIRLRSGTVMPGIGFGTWRIGESRSQAEAELAALRHALARGFRHFDTAEMYGEGGSETLLGQAIAGWPREALFITSKFYPHHARADQMERACERSLRRLGIECLDLYLLHWPGSTPLEETLRGAERLRAAGKIRAFGVSNFDIEDIAAAVSDDADRLVDVNQVLYNPGRRGIEFDLLPFLGKAGIACVAYSPIEPGRLGANRGFAEVARGAGLSPARLALAWHMTRSGACPIPKSATPAHVDALAAAAVMRLPDEVMAAVDEACPPPRRREPLEIL
ncbi:aldo/keto reductase [Paralimibaculum aggregatum]|uniref:Aldo/keto reductase n=1 Tax=Paralimibaculum aggregatum TaxID=3036245 RepID=A0ABQ6LLU9_9RHOB|nr:aldo/keto reductase [Limibaculum sp. NKW23]GMG84181.1 aldo/keto reductase [Limibaculum sp. NKW23]